MAHGCMTTAAASSDEGFIHRHRPQATGYPAYTNEVGVKKEKEKEEERLTLSVNINFVGRRHNQSGSLKIIRQSKKYQN